MRNPRGFTLVEVAIAMLIMSFISVATVQAIQRALATRSKVQKDIDKNSTLRDALRIMERDINMAFNYRDPTIELYNLAQQERKKADQAASGTGTGGTGSGTATGTGTPTTTNPLDEEKYKQKEQKIVTHFIGEVESLDFTSLSNVRVTEDAKVSSQAEIGYRIKPCRRRTTQEQSSRCLWRRISDYIHEEDITKHGQETVLLENITEFKLRYLGPGRDGEWVDSWITNERGDDLTRFRFPYAVEITIAVKDPDPKAKDKTLRMTTVASIRNPNNPVEKTEEQKQQEQLQNQLGIGGGVKQ